MSYTKAYENKPIWINNREPSINAPRLNALSGAVDVIDNRVIDLDDKRIENIAGVNTNNRQDGQVLAYNETTNSWENRYISGPEGSPSYTPLLDKPQINGHVLSGNLTGKDLLLDNKTTTNRDLSDSTEGGLLIHHIDGKSTQNGIPTPTSPVPIESVSVKVKTVGKNLIAYPYLQDTRTVNGITFTVNNDGSIIANGTATANAQLLLYSTSSTALDLGIGDYVLSGGVNNNAYIQIPSVTGFAGVSSRGSAVSFSITTSVSVGIRVYIPNGTTCDNLVFKPMVVKVNADGTYPTTFEKGYTSVADTSLVLRSIGDIKDELIFEDNKYKVLRRIGNYIVPSDVTISTYPNFDTTNMKGARFIMPYNTANIPNYTDINGICNIMPTYYKGISIVKPLDTPAGILQTSTTASNNLVFYFKFSSIDDFRTYLQNNQVELVYELANPTVEELTDEAVKLLGLKSWNEQTHITLDSAIDTPITVEYATNNGNGRGLNGYTVALANEIKLNQLTMANMLS